MGVNLTERPPEKIKQAGYLSLWPKSFYGLIWGLLISISFVMNLYHFLPLETSTFLLTSLVVSFLIWGAVMLYCYSCSRHKQINMVCLKLFSVSLLLNLVCSFVSLVVGV